jgi:hypothetical protein
MVVFDTGKRMIGTAERALMAERALYQYGKTGGGSA